VNNDPVRGSRGAGQPGGGAPAEDAPASCQKNSSNFHFNLPMDRRCRRSRRWGNEAERSGTLPDDRSKRCFATGNDLYSLGKTADKEAGVVRRTDDSSLLNMILEKQEKLHHIRDLNTLLDNLLYETRSLTKADAGSIFLVQGKKLQFSYVQNDSLFKNDFLSKAPTQNNSYKLV
jgi:hypothetical protein